MFVVKWHYINTIYYFIRFKHVKMRLTKWDGLSFAICAVFRLHQWSEGHRDDFFGLPGV